MLILRRFAVRHCTRRVFSTATPSDKKLGMQNVIVAGTLIGFVGSVYMYTGHRIRLVSVLLVCDCFTLRIRISTYYSESGTW